MLAALLLLIMLTEGPQPSAAASLAAAKSIEPPSAVRRHAARMVDYAFVDARLKRLMADENKVGLAVGIVEDGQITYLRGYGETLDGTGDPVTADTVFRWASVSKGVASTLVAKLAADGKLSLQDPVALYARSLRLPAGGEQKATVADVLTHRLGIFSNAQDSKLEDGGDPRFLRSMLATLTPICPIGSCHAYQNLAYDASSETVEKVTGKPYDDVAVERLFAPLGMESATVGRAGLIGAASWARPHNAAGTPQPRGLSEAYYRVPASGGVNSSIRDLTRWMQAQMGEAPNALPAKLLRTLHAPRVKTPVEERRQRKFRDRIGDSHYALGWRVYDYAGHRVVGHRGGVSGYRALMLFDPDKRSGIAALWNTSDGQPAGIEFEVMDMIYGLDRRDWLALDTPQAVPHPQAPALDAAATARSDTDATGAAAISTRAQIGR